MMQHFQNNPGNKIKYVLFSHFPNQPATSDSPIGKAEFEAALASKNKELDKYTEYLRDKIDLDLFIPQFSLQFGPSFDALVAEVCLALQDAGISESDIDTLAYPNAIHTIASLSIKHDPAERKISKNWLLGYLQQVKKTAVSRWTLALKTRKQILDAKRKQLKSNLDKNTRLRYFLVHVDSLDDFDSDFVMFVSDYLDKYHFKAAHINTPIICLNTTEEIFRTIQLRLHKKGIVSTDGCVGSHFDERRFFRAPMLQRAHRGVQREFSLRILRWESHGSILNNRKADDLFVFGLDEYNGLDTVDINVEMLAAPSLREIKYVMGVSNVYE
ncbi:MAG: hypothetical protein ACYDDN_11820, partial [Candidatus Desulforudaceae bacterium]